MAYALTTLEAQQATECARLLAMPFEFGGLEEWSREFGARLSRVLGADGISLAIPDRDRLYAYSDGLPPGTVGKYIEVHLVNECERRWRLLSRQLEFGTWSRRLLWGSNGSDILRSAYWNDFVVPARAFDTIGVSTAIDAHPGVANLQFYHERARGRKFGERGMAILRTIYPAFASAIRSVVALRAHHDQLAVFADTLSVGVIVTSLDARIVHRNLRFERMLAEETERLKLEDEIWRRIERFRRQWRSRDHLMPRAPSGPSSDVVRTTRASYRISTCSLATALFRGTGAIATTVERLGPPPFPAALLRERFGLTTRELETARLLAEGKGNPEIASTLGVSVFTARHHTESVMLKLSVRTRAQVGALVAQLPTGG